VKGCFLEDLYVGQTAEKHYLADEAAVERFAEASGDRNPLHMDEAFAAESFFKGRIAHGMLAGAYLSAVLGTMLPGPGAIYMSQTLNFRRPVRIGDEVTAKVTVTAIDEAKGRVSFSTLCSVGGKKVVTGEAVMLVSRRGA
jgi:3-hydroxybutyryl-CoA dehydratase